MMNDKENVTNKIVRYFNGYCFAPYLVEKIIHGEMIRFGCTIIIAIKLVYISRCFYSVTCKRIIFFFFVIILLTTIKKWMFVHFTHFTHKAFNLVYITCVFQLVAPQILPNIL